MVENSSRSGGSPPGKVFEAVAADQLVVTDSAYAMVRRDMAVYHLRAAFRAAKEAEQIEAEHGDWFEELLMLVPVSVAMAGAALEANANEIIQDLLDENIIDGIAPLPLSSEQRGELKTLKTKRSGNSVEKYKQLAKLFGKVPTLGDATWSRAHLLIEFRNNLMHFKPEWDDNSPPDERALASKLADHLQANRFFPNPSAFPTRS